MKRKLLTLIVSLTMVLSASCADSSSQNGGDSSSVSERSSSSQNATWGNDGSSSSDTADNYKKYEGLTADQIVEKMTLEQKVSQMVLPELKEVDSEKLKQNCYGGVLSKTRPLTSAQWRQTVDDLQKGAISSECGIPIIYGQDDVHGVYACLNAVIFPHNIGLAAANDKDLMYKMGQITADEAKLCHMLWNYSPVIAQSVDPRWGRTYECLGSDLGTITELSTAYSKGLLDGGMIVCAKHFFGDGNVGYGTGEQGNVKMLIDRGDAKLTDAQIDELLKVFKTQIDAGVQTIMISHSAVNGVKMHENKKYIEKLKNEMGFKGFIVSDWNSVQNTSPSTYEEQIITSVNAGIDMFMEVDTFEQVKNIIVSSVNIGKISQERIDDAVKRIVKVKLDAGVFKDPLFENTKTKQSETGSEEYRKVAQQLVEKSLVLVKNENKVLPFKKGTSVYITGPAADNAQAQCGGWTLDWNSSPEKDIDGVTTIVAGFKQIAEKNGIKVITDKNEASKADVVLLCVGEQSYAEWNGDTEDLALCGKLGLEGNAEAINEAKSLGKPTVACIVAGRNVIIDEQNRKNWDSIVMCYLPGSEGQGVANVLCGNSNFSGKLPSPWYSDLKQIGTDECWLKRGFGLNYQ